MKMIHAHTRTNWSILHIYFMYECSREQVNIVPTCQRQHLGAHKLNYILRTHLNSFLSKTRWWVLMWMQASRLYLCAYAVTDWPHITVLENTRSSGKGESDKCAENLRFQWVSLLVMATPAEDDLYVTWMCEPWAVAMIRNLWGFTPRIYHQCFLRLLSSKTAHTIIGPTARILFIRVSRLSI